jgi:hypothetical protein
MVEIFEKVHTTGEHEQQNGDRPRVLAPIDGDHLRNELPEAHQLVVA